MTPEDEHDILKALAIKQDIVKLIKETPNDQELGIKVRALIKKYILI